MLGFLTLASSERAGFSDGKEAFYGRADRVCSEAGLVGHIGDRSDPQARHQRADVLPVEEAVHGTRHRRVASAPAAHAGAEVQPCS